MRFHFIAERNSETGELGWKDSRIASGSPYDSLATPIGLAHDVIEHAKLETVADEIQAHAAMYHIRYEGGYINDVGRNLSLEDFGFEWVNLALAINEYGLEKSPRRTKKLDASIEEDISQIIEYGRKSVLDNLDDAALSVEIEASFRGWFRIGYRNTLRRWKGWQAHDIGYLFGAVADTFERYSPEYEGMNILLNISKDGQVSVRELPFAF